MSARALRAAGATLAVGAAITGAAVVGYGMGKDDTPAPSAPDALTAAQALSPLVLIDAAGTVYLPADTVHGWTYDGRTFYPVDPAAIPEGVGK